MNTTNKVCKGKKVTQTKDRELKAQFKTETKIKSNKVKKLITKQKLKATK